MATAKRCREKRKARLAAGLCGMCGKRPCEEGLKACRPCLDRAQDNAYVSPEMRTLLIEQGLCHRCLKQDATRGAVCAPCHAQITRVRTNMRWNRQKAGLCVRCGKTPPESGVLECQPCKIKNAKRP